MSITRSLAVIELTDGIPTIEQLVELERNSKHYFSWKDRVLDMWITEFLFDKHKHTTISAENGMLLIAVITFDTIQKMVDCLTEGDYSFCEDTNSFLEKGAFEWVFQQAATELKRLIDENNSCSAVFLYVDAGE